MELMAKRKNLKPGSDRPRGADQPKADPKWIEIFNQFQAKKKQQRKKNKNL